MIKITQDRITKLKEQFGIPIDFTTDDDIVVDSYNRYRSNRQIEEDRYLATFLGDTEIEDEEQAKLGKRLCMAPFALLAKTLRIGIRAITGNPPAIEHKAGIDLRDFSEVPNRR